MRSLWRFYSALYSAAVAAGNAPSGEVDSGGQRASVLSWETCNGISKTHCDPELLLGGAVLELEIAILRYSEIRLLRAEVAMLETCLCPSRRTVISHRVLAER